MHRSLLHLLFGIPIRFQQQQPSACHIISSSSSFLFSSPWKGGRRCRLFSSKKSSSKMDTASNRYFPITDHSIELCRRNPWHKPSACYETAQELYEHAFEKYRRPIGSLYTGSMGVRAYVRYRLAKLLKVMNDQERYQKKMDKLLYNAFDCAFAYTKDRSLEQPGTVKNLHRITMLESTYVGAKALVVAILHAQGKHDESYEMAKWLIADLRSMCMQYPTSECEILYGRAGAITAILFMRAEIGDPTLGSELVCDLASEILQEGIFYASKSNHTPKLTLLWEWHRKPYLGAAHGVAGILQTLLSLNPSEIERVNAKLQINTFQLIQMTIDEMNAKCCFASGNLKSSLTHGRDSSEDDRLVQWCHGAPGHVLLLLKAYDVTNETKYLELAVTITQNVIWPRGLLRKGVGLCHGIAGNAYVFLALHARLQQQQAQKKISSSETTTLTKPNTTYLEYARTYAEFAIRNMETLETVPDRPYSLYEGTCGLIILLMDLAHIAIDANYQARFPLYEY